VGRTDDELMRLKPFARWFPDRIYRVTFFVICCREQDFIPTLRKLVGRTNCPDKQGLVRAVEASPHDMTDVNGRCFRIAGKATPCAVIWLRPGVDVSTLVHELWHALFWIFRDRGVQFDDGVGADEPVAYYLQAIVRQSLELPDGRLRPTRRR
jgi:hypothetical protein